ncbi:MAG: 2'-5' RNA ligase family protein [Candidatus Kerfeldbacteria bacterium]
MFNSDRIHTIQNRFTIVALVPEPFASQFAAMRRQYDTFCRQWLPPHVTLVPPFDMFLSRADKQVICELSVQCTASFIGLDAIIRKYTSVLFYKLPDKSFDELRKAIYDAVPTLPAPERDDSSYHVTVASRIPNELLESLKKEVEKHEVKGSFTVDRATLYSWDDYVRQWIEVT